MSADSDLWPQMVATKPKKTIGKTIIARGEGGCKRRKSGVMRHGRDIKKCAGTGTPHDSAPMSARAVPNKCTFLMIFFEAMTTRATRHVT